MQARTPVFLALSALVACSGGGDIVQVPVVDAAADAPVLPPPPPPDAGSHPDTSVEDAADANVPASGPVSSTPGGVFEAEDQIAVAPDGRIGILWSAIASGGLGMAYRFSADDGATFSPIARITIAPGIYPGDPAIIAAPNGDFYAAFLGLHYSGQSVDYTRVYFAKAPKGSTTFSAPIEVSDTAATRFYDHPKIFVTSKGKIVVTFMQADSLTAQTAIGIAATSTDGAAWARNTIVQPPAAVFSNLFSMCEGAGAVYVTYYEATQTTAGVVLRKSADDGLTWSTTSVHATLDAEIPAGLDPTCVASGADVWVAYATTDTPSTSDTKLDAAKAIRVAHSSDGGGSFAAARMDALDTAATKLGCLPQLVREPGGALDVVYIGGASDGDAAGSLRYARATGASFAPSVKLDSPLLFDMSRNTKTWLGDYFGAVSHAGALYVAYPKAEGGATHIFFQKTPLP